MIGLKKSSVFERHRAMGFCRSTRRSFGFKMAMRRFRTGPIRLVLSASSTKQGRYYSDELDRCAVHADAVLRKSEDGCVFGMSGISGQSEACSTVDAGDGNFWDMPWAQYQLAQNGSCGVSVSSERSCDQSAQSCLEYGYYLYSSCSWVCVFGSGVGLVFSIRSFVETVQYAGDVFLYGGSRRGIKRSHSRYFQYGR